MIAMLLLLQLLKKIQRTDARGSDMLTLMLLLLDIHVSGDDESGGRRDGALEFIDVDRRLTRRGSWAGGLLRGVKGKRLLELLLLVLLEEEVLLFSQHGLVLHFLELGLLDLGLLEGLELVVGVHLGLGLQLGVDVGVDLLMMLLLFHSQRDGFLHLRGSHTFTPCRSLSFFGC
jgi:hypothetical protein